MVNESCIVSPQQPHQKLINNLIISVNPAMYNRFLHLKSTSLFLKNIQLIDLKQISNCYVNIVLIRSQNIHFQLLNLSAKHKR
ncbi:TPA: hypothetical protein MFL74_004318 [Klebsiella pneumoniae]|nr:hypothetical protein [Klebsiella pneumoniae]